ncbi:phospholipid scramblase 4-like [Gracilinanus agilis]|uniref:phospholipid scramblase 4-like n=1 Tax=Gracilinanus agilis TaxID=191870 RepID=UPI001CFDDB19|nr:phospholipid scramblase 4-like [Gracilinanus agilis]
MQAPTAPTAPVNDMEKSPHPRPEDPPSYPSHYQPGPPGPVGYPTAGYPGPGPVGYVAPYQPGGMPMYYPSGGQPIMYQPGFNMNLNQPPQISWMPGPPPLPNSPPGLEYLSQLEVQSPPGVPLGYIRQHWGFCKAKFSIENEKKEHVMDMDGPCSPCACGSDIVYRVKSLDGTNIGSISRQWPGCLQEAVADIDNFEISFPLDLNITMKAMIFAACFLIDFMFFEYTPRNNRHHH